MGRMLVLSNLAKLSKYMGEVEVNISASIKAPCTKYFLRFLKHTGIFVDHLGGVDTPMAPKNWAKLDKYMESGDVNISASIRAPCIKYFWRFLRHTETFLDHFEVLTCLWAEWQHPKLA